MDRDEQRRARARARAAWPITRHELREEPVDDLLARTTARERFAMVWSLTLDAWALRGEAIPDYDRQNAPGKMVRGRE